MCQHVYTYYLACKHIHKSTKLSVYTHCQIVDEALCFYHLQPRYQPFTNNPDTIPIPTKCPEVCGPPGPDNESREEAVQRMYNDPQHLWLLQRLHHETDGKNSFARQYNIDMAVWSPLNEAMVKVNKDKSPRGLTAAVNGRPEMHRHLNFPEYPARYIQHMTRTREIQQGIRECASDPWHSIHLESQNIITVISPIGCGRYDNPACLTGHVEEQSPQCPWLLGFRMQRWPKPIQLASRELHILRGPNPSERGRQLERGERFHPLINEAVRYELTAHGPRALPAALPQLVHTGLERLGGGTGQGANGSRHPWVAIMHGMQQPYPTPSQHVNTVAGPSVASPGASVKPPRGLDAPTPACSILLHAPTPPVSAQEIVRLPTSSDTPPTSPHSSNSSHTAHSLLATLPQTQTETSRVQTERGRRRSASMPPMVKGKEERVRMRGEEE